MNIKHDVVGGGWDMGEEQKRNQDAFVDGILQALHGGIVQVPVFFMQHYRQAGLDDLDAMFILHLLAFRLEHKEFPLFDELQARMSCTNEALLKSLQKMMKLGLLHIEETADPRTGLRAERYDVSPALRKAIECHAATKKQPPVAATVGKRESIDTVQGTRDVSLYKAFEAEFGRLLSPMECETIQKWMDEERLVEPLIRHALREAVFAGKLHFRYIDRILMDWRQQNIQTVEQAKAHAAKFRGQR
jgi:DNA replication protein